MARPIASEAELTPHLARGELPERIAASESHVWVLTARQVLAVSEDSRIRQVLSAPVGDVFTHIGAAGRTIGVATHGKRLYVARDGEEFAPTKGPALGRRARVSSLLVHPRGELWLEVEEGQPAQWAWWCRRAGGHWQRQIDAEVARATATLGRVASPILDEQGLVGVSDVREPNPFSNGESQLYLRRQRLRRLGGAWPQRVDPAGALPPIVSGCGDEIWNGPVCLAHAQEAGEAVWLLGRPDRLYRIQSGRLETIDLAAHQLVSDGHSSVLAIVTDEDDQDRLHRSRDAGRTFLAADSLGTRRLVRSDPYHSAVTFLGAIACMCVAHPPSGRSWVVRQV